MLSVEHCKVEPYVANGSYLYYYIMTIYVPTAAINFLILYHLILVSYHNVSHLLSYGLQLKKILQRIRKERGSALPFDGICSFCCAVQLA